MRSCTYLLNKREENEPTKAIANNARIDPAYWQQHRGAPPVINRTSLVWPRRSPT